MFVTRAYTASETTNITSVLPTANSNKTRVNMGTTLVTQLAMSSAAAGISGGTKTNDAQAFARAIFTNVIGLGTGTLYQVIYENDVNAQHPLVLSANEGLVFTSPVGVASGAVVVGITIAWAEVVTL